MFNPHTNTKLLWLQNVRQVMHVKYAVFTDLFLRVVLHLE